MKRSKKTPPATDTNVPEDGPSSVGEEALPPRKLVTRPFQELWFRLARENWRSLVLVPAQRDGSAAAIASELADAARSIRIVPVTLFVMAAPADYEPAVKIVVGAGASQAIQRADDAVDYAGATQIVARAAYGTEEGTERSSGPGKVIVAVQPVISEPLGLAVTQRADVVLLCIEEGSTRLADAQKTIELIGRDRIAGCIYIRN